MKKILYFLALIPFLCTVSCSLDEESYTEISKEKYMNDASEAENVLLGVYRSMIPDAVYGFNLSLLFTLPSDIAKVEGSSVNSWRAEASNAFNASDSYVLQTWYALYKAVYNANDFIEALASKSEGYSDDDKKLAAIYMGEARALRAMYYFELVRWWGNIILVKSTAEAEQPASSFAQASPQEVYEFIEKDLLYAIDVLPYASDDAVRSSNSYRFSKGAALGLLTKVYATWAGCPVQDETKWEAAAKTAKILIESGKHHLLDSYEQLWYNTANNTWDSSESLIEVSFYSPTITGDSSYDSSGRIGKWNGVTAPDGAISAGRVAANWKVVPSFLASWKDRAKDLRFKLSFADYKYTAETGKTYLLTVDGTGVPFERVLEADAKTDWKKTFNASLCPAKWDIGKYVDESNILVDANMSNVNWYILRYADVLLLYAEAINEWHKTPTAAAYEAVNMVRRRGFGLPVNTASSVSDLSSGLSYQDFRQAVRDERAYELGFEGHRRQDLVRWGIYYESIMQTYSDLMDWHESAPDYYVCAQYTKKGQHELLPIPQTDMDMFDPSKVKQNPLW